MNKKAFGKTLKKYREEKNITQKELASMLSAVPQTISSWECGQSYPDLESVEAICKILDIKEQDLFEKTRELEAQEEKSHVKSIVVGVVSTVVAVSLLVGGIFLISHSGSDKKGAALIATEANGITEQDGAPEQAEVLIDKDAAIAKIKTLLEECIANGPGYSSNPFDYMDNDAYKELKSMGENVLPIIAELHESGSFEGLEDYIAVYLLLDISGMGDLDKLPEKYKADANGLYDYWKRYYEYTYHFSVIDKLYNKIKAPADGKILHMPKGDIESIITEWNRKKLGGQIGQYFTDDENYYMIKIDFTYALDLIPSKEQLANMACEILEELEEKGISAFYDATDGCVYMYIHAGDFKRLDLKSAPDCVYSWY